MAEQDFVMIRTEYPTEAEASAVLDLMKAAQGLPFNIGGNCKREYIAAALAIRKSLFRKDSGEPNYTAAARHYVTDCASSGGDQVKGWVRKLELFELIKRQAELASDLEALDPASMILEDVALPLSSPPVSAMPSPPYTESEPSVVELRESTPRAMQQLITLRKVADQHLRDNARRGILTIQATARRFLVKLAEQGERVRRASAVHAIQRRVRRYMSEFVRNQTVTKTTLRWQSLRLAKELTELSERKINESSDRKALQTLEIANHDLMVEIEQLESRLKKAESMRGLLDERLAKAKAKESKVLKVEGYSCWETRAAGRLCWEAKLAGYSSKEANEAGFSCKELAEAGYTCQEAKAAGFSCLEAKDAGFSCRDVKVAGYSCNEASEAGWASLPELKAAGFTAGVKEAGFSWSDLKAAGYTCQQAKAAGFSCSDLKAVGFSCSDLKAGGFSCSYLKAAGFSPKECRNGGFSENELDHAGWKRTSWDSWS